MLSVVDWDTSEDLVRWTGRELWWAPAQWTDIEEHLHDLLIILGDSKRGEVDMEDVLVTACAFWTSELYLEGNERSLRAGQFGHWVSLTEPLGATIVNLQDLDMSFFRFTGATLCHILNALPNLSRLVLYYCTSPRDALEVALLGVAPRFTYLHLRIEGVKQWFDKLLARLGMVTVLTVDYQLFHASTMASRLPDTVNRLDLYVFASDDHMLLAREVERRMPALREITLSPRLTEDWLTMIDMKDRWYIARMRKALKDGTEDLAVRSHLPSPKMSADQLTARL